MNAAQSRLPDRYRVIEEVGQGGMAVVFRAHDEKLGREVAVKVLHAHLVAEPESKARLEREAQAVAKLQHDGIVQIYDYSGGESSSAYIVTEFVDGQTLKQFIGKRAVSTPEIAALIVAEVGTALAHAHGLGIIHRDIKPENVMVRRDGALKLMDFGVAQILDLERMTVTGQLLGSPAYMAPELIEGKQVDFRTDVFALGIMLFQLATGQLPFSGRNPHEVFKRIAEGRFPDPRGLNPLVGVDLYRIIARALGRRPEDRHPTVDALVADLLAYAAAAGLTDPHEETRLFFTSADGVYEGALRPRLCDGLLRSARAARAERKVARCLELLGRALALTPEHAGARAELRALEGGQRWKRVFVLTGVAVVMAGAIVAWTHLSKGISSHSTTGSSAPPSIANAPTTDNTAQGALLSEMDPATTPPAVVNDPRRRPRVDEPGARENPRRPPPATKPQTLRLSLGPTPQNVEVFLDGEKRFDYGPGHDALDIPWTGQHSIEFRNPCCFPEHVVVGPQDYRPPEDRVTVRLRGRPARLTVLTDPPTTGALILITSKTTRPGAPLRLPATTGEPIPIPFDQGDDLRKSLDVNVSMSAEGSATASVVVVAGEKKTVTVRLKK